MHIMCSWSQIYQAQKFLLLLKVILVGYASNARNIGLETFLVKESGRTPVGVIKSLLEWDFI